MDSNIVQAKQTLVTIGLPVYNGENFIAYGLKSILFKIYAKFELIITDDGSTDNSVNEIMKYEALLGNKSNYKMEQRIVASKS